MKATKGQKQKPWLSPNGVAIPTGDLKEIVKSWDIQTWEAYLKWFDRPCREMLVTPGAYAEIGESIEQTIFEQFDQSATPAKRHLCERLLEKLPDHQGAILRLFFLEGLSDSKIAVLVKRSRTNVGHHKNQALNRLKRENSGNIWVICQFMRGVRSNASKKIITSWDQAVQNQLKESRVYLPENQTSELEYLKNSSLRTALRELSPRARAIIYLRHFCDFSVRQAAQRLSIGLNVVEMTEAAAISRLKRNYVQFETGVRPGEGDLC